MACFVFNNTVFLFYFYVEAQDSAAHHNASLLVLISDSHLAALYSQVE